MTKTSSQIGRTKDWLEQVTYKMTKWIGRRLTKVESGPS
jgi:hypothetical protein